MKGEEEEFFSAIEEQDLVLLTQLTTQHPELVKSTDQEGRTGLYLAVENGYNLVAIFLLSSGSDVNSKTPEQWTPLHLASAKGNIQFVKFLLDKGAKISERTDDNLNAFHIAAYYGNTEVLNELLERGGINPNETGGRSNWTALHLSTVNGHLSAVKFLLDKGADINSTKKPQGSCLHLAVKEKHSGIFTMLLNRGIDIEMRDSRGKTAIEMVEGNSAFEEIYNNFLKQKADDLKLQSSAIGGDDNDDDDDEYDVDDDDDDDDDSEDFEIGLTSSGNIKVGGIVVDTMSESRSSTVLKDKQEVQQLPPSSLVNRSPPPPPPRGAAIIINQKAPLPEAANSPIPNIAPLVPPPRNYIKSNEENHINNNNSNNNTEDETAESDIADKENHQHRIGDDTDDDMKRNSSNIKSGSNNNNKRNATMREGPQRAEVKWVRTNSQLQSQPNQFLTKTEITPQEITEIRSIKKALHHIQKNRESKRMSMRKGRVVTFDVASMKRDDSLTEHQKYKRMTLHPEVIDSVYSDEAPPLWGNTPLMNEDELQSSNDESGDQSPISEQQEAEVEDETQKLKSDQPDKYLITNNIVAYPGADKGVQEEKMVWSWLSKVAGAVIDDQAQEALEHILRLLNTLFHDRDQKRSIDALLALSLVAIKYDNKPISSNVTVTPNEMQVASYYFKFACAAYGWKMLNPLMFSNKQARVLFQGITVGDPMNRRALCEHTGISETDILVDKWTSSDYHPAHYIAVDHNSLSIIVAVRGSFHVKDALVDLIASATPFKNGFAHTGMLECARRKLDSIRHIVESALNDFPSYQVVVVGHSLGAGTASLLTILLRDEFPKRKIRCYAYATPCVLSAELALSCSSYITSYVLSDDCVPRLSYGSIELLKNLTTKIMNQSRSTVKLLFLIKRGKLDVQKLRNEIVTAIEERLLPPGTVYQILKETKQPWILPEDLPKCFKMEISNPTFFGELILSSSMFSDHLPWNYHHAFNGIEYREKLFVEQQNQPPLMAERAPTLVHKSSTLLSTFRRNVNRSNTKTIIEN